MSLAYFQKALNYTLANEDTRFEVSMLEGRRIDHLLSIAGAGGRVLPLLASGPRVVTCVDVSETQLQLTELRFEALRALELAEYLEFWGYPPNGGTPARRRELFERIRPRLSGPTRKFFSGYFEANGWTSLLYDGKWERTFAFLAGVNRRLTGSRGLGLFSALNEAEHQAYLEERFPWKAWSLLLFTLGNAGVFNSLLYKGHFPRKNIPQSFYRFYSESFERLFRQGPARRNFFLQLVFFGKVIFEDGLPVECDPEVYARARKAIDQAEIRYRQGDVIEQALACRKEGQPPLDFVSLSDVPSYFKGETEKKFMRDLQPALAAEAQVVVRNYLHVPEGLDLTGYERITEEFRREIDAEKVGVYLIDVFRRSG